MTEPTPLNRLLALLDQDHTAPFDLNWNEGPNGGMVTWLNGQRSVLQGKPYQRRLRGPGRARVNSLHHTSQVNAATGTVGIGVYLLCTGGQVSLTPAAVPPAAAHVMSLYLGAPQFVNGATPRPQLTLTFARDTSSAYTLEFTPMPDTDDLMIVSGHLNMTDACILPAEQQEDLHTLLQRAVALDEINTPAYLHRYAALNGIINDRLTHTRTTRLDATVQFSPQNVRLLRDVTSVRTVTHDRPTVPHPRTDEHGTIRDVTAVTLGPTNAAQVTLHVPGLLDLPLHTELCLMIAEALQGWMTGEQHELQITDHAHARAAGAGPNDPGGVLTFLPERAREREESPPGLLIDTRGYALPDACRGHPWLRVPPALFGPLLRALFTANRHTLTGTA